MSSMLRPMEQFVRTLQAARRVSTTSDQIGSPTTSNKTMTL